MIKTLSGERSKMLASFKLAAKFGGAYAWKNPQEYNALTMETEMRKLSADTWRAEMVEAINRIRKSNLVYAPGVIGKPIAAYINHSRWVADCPYCKGAEMVDPGEAFYCFSCGMEKNGGHPQPLEFPKQSERNEIERILDVRTESHRNWTAGESRDFLEKGNRAHGLGA